eukprot:g4824.t1
MRHEVQWTVEVYDPDTGDGGEWERGSVRAVEVDAAGNVTLIASIAGLVDSPLQLGEDVRVVSREGGGEEIYDRVVHELDRQKAGAAADAAAPSSSSSSSSSSSVSAALATAGKPPQPEAGRDEPASKPTSKPTSKPKKEAVGVQEALGIAARGGDLAQLQRLMTGVPAKRQRALLSSRGWHGKTPLYWAATYGHEDVVQFLLQSKVDVNAASKGGHTALMGASFTGQTAVVRLLLQHKASRFRADAQGRSAVQHATRHNPITKGSAQLRDELTDLVGYTSMQKLRSTVCTVS